MDIPPFLIALDLTARPVVVFGGGAEAVRRACALNDAGAQVTVVGKTPGPELEALAATRPGLTLVRRLPETQDLDGQWLAVVTDQNPAWVDELGPKAARAQIWFCAVDQPKHNSFSHVGIVDAGPLRLGISTGGKAPALAGALTRELHRVFEATKFTQLVESVVALRATLPQSERANALRSWAKRFKIYFSYEITDDSSVPSTDVSSANTPESVPLVSNHSPSGGHADP